MAALTTQLRLIFTAPTGPIVQAIGKMRELRGAAAQFFQQSRNDKGQFMPSQFQKLGGDIFGPSAGAFRVASHIGQAAGAMQQFRSQLDGVTRGPIDKFAQFELMMARVKGRTDNITGAGFEALKKAAADAGATTSFTATEAAEGLFELAGAGLTVQQQIAALNPVLRLAQASQMGLGQTSAIATNTMAQFGLSVSEIPYISDILNTAANASTIELGELGDTMKYAGTLAKNAGLDLKQTATFAALLGNAGITGSMAGTSLRAMLGRLANASPRAKKALAEVGLSAKDMAKGVKDPISFFKQLDGAFKNKKFDEQKRLSALMRIFGDEAASGVASLLDAGAKADAKGLTAFDRMAVSMDGYSGSVERFASTVENTTAGKLKIFESQVDALQMQLGEAFVPALMDITKAIGPVIQDLGAWAKENPRLIATMGRLALGASAMLAVLGPLALGISSVITVWGVFGPAFRLGLLPIRGAGSALGALAGRLDAMPGKFGSAAGAFTRFTAITGAAFAGWEVGTILDEALGKLLKLRGGLVSTEAALQMGESGGFNDLIGGIGNVTGIQAIKDVAEGNRQANANKLAAEREAQARAGAGGPATAEIDVKISDERTIVATKTAAGAKVHKPMRTGSSVPNMD